MTIREEIIKLLDVPVGELSEYDKLKKCLFINAPYKGVVDTFRYKEAEESYKDFTGHSFISIDTWLQGVIQSLFYKPNKYLLVLEGEEGIGKDSFFANLLPDEQLYEERRTCISLYSTLIVNIEFFKNMLNIPLEDGFIILEDNAKFLIHPGTDKRLCSYCTTTEKWRYPQRKNVIVLSVESIDWELYNSIDKLKLWQELFFKYKTTNNDTNL